MTNCSQNELGASPPEPDPAQKALLKQIKSSLQSYAFLFTIIGTAFTGINFFGQVYIRSMDRGDELYKNAALLTSQSYLAKLSNHGTSYSVEMMSDPQFDVSLRSLLNYYESTSDVANSWFSMGSVIRSEIQCPLVKHVRIFLLGISKDGYWKTDDHFFTVSQFPKTYEMYKQAQVGADKECDSVWKPR